MKTTTTKLHKKLTRKARQGFSLVELLVVIAVIGIIAAIAIPNIAGITGSANAAKDQRNAQNLASVYASAVAAGAPGVGATGGPADKAAAVTLLTGAGMTAGTAPNTMTFNVPNLVVATATDNVRAYLNANMGYVAAGGQTE